MFASASRATPISLADLTALNDEIAALARAGVPLEKGLRELGPDLPRRLSRITAELAERLSQGESLADAVGHGGGEFPPIYRAVVEAGVRAGRLPVALEGLAHSARLLAEVRRLVSAAMLYPLILLLMAYGMLVFFVVKLLPNLVAVFEIGRSGATRLPPLIESLRGLGRGVDVWGPVFPLLIVLAAGIWWYRTGRSPVLEGRGGMLIWLPSVRRLVGNARSACLSDMLALLLEHQVPLHEAIVLAAGATGDPATMQSAQRISDALRQGTIVPARGERMAGFPPLLSWLITNEGAQARLVPLLRHTAENYREQVFRQSIWLKTYLPAIFTLTIGGTAVAAYTISVFAPMADLLEHLAAVGTNLR